MVGLAGKVDDGRPRQLHLPRRQSHRKANLLLCVGGEILHLPHPGPVTLYPNLPMAGFTVGLNLSTGVST